MCHGKRSVVILCDTGEGRVTGNGQWSFCVTQVGTCHGKWPVGHLAPRSVSSYGIRLAIASCMQYPHPHALCSAVSTSTRLTVRIRGSRAKHTPCCTLHI